MFIVNASTVLNTSDEPTTGRIGKITCRFLIQGVGEAASGATPRSPSSTPNPPTDSSNPSAPPSTDERRVVSPTGTTASARRDSRPTPIAASRTGVCGERAVRAGGRPAGEALRSTGWHGPCVASLREMIGLTGVREEEFRIALCWLENGTSGNARCVAEMGAVRARLKTDIALRTLRRGHRRRRGVLGRRPTGLQQGNRSVDSTG